LTGGPTGPLSARLGGTGGVAAPVPPAELPAASELREQALEVALVVPRADRRPHERRGRQVADDHAGGDEAVARGERVVGLPGDERGGAARRDRRAAVTQRVGQARGERDRALVHRVPAEGVERRVRGEGKGG